MSDLGFTGSRIGKTIESEKTFRAFLVGAQPTVFRNGLCIGWDGQAVRIVREMFPMCRIIGYPGRGRNDAGTERPDRDWAAQEMCDEVKPEQPHFTRNRDIVADCGRLVACPSNRVPQHGGTWMTIYFARQYHRKSTIIYPDGAEAS